MTQETLPSNQTFLQPATIPAQVEKHLDLVEFCEDGYLLLGSSNLTDRYWIGSIWYYTEPAFAPDVEKCLTAVDCESGVCDAKFLNNRDKVIIGGDSGFVEVMQLSGPEDGGIYNFSTIASAPCDHDDSVVSISLTKEKTFAVTGSSDMTIRVWDTSLLTSEHVYQPAHGAAVNSVDCHSVQVSVFASCAQDGDVLVWDRRMSKPARKIWGSTCDTPCCVRWHPAQDNGLLVGSLLGNLSVFDTRRLSQPAEQLRIFQRPVFRMAFADHCHNLIAACADDSPVKVINIGLEEPEIVYCDDRHNDFVRGLAWNPKTQNLYSCGWDKKVLSHDVSGMEMNGDAGGESLFS